MYFIKYRRSMIMTVILSFPIEKGSLLHAAKAVRTKLEQARIEGKIKGWKNLGRHREETKEGKKAPYNGDFVDIEFEDEQDAVIGKMIAP